MPGICLGGRRNKADKAGAGNLTPSNLLLPSWLEKALDLLFCLLSWRRFACLENQRNVTNRKLPKQNRKKELLDQ